MALEEWTSIFNDKIEELNRADSWHLKFSKSIVQLEADIPGPGWKQYIRHAMASFTCSKCKRYWTSNRVMVLFHFRLAVGKGTVKVRRFRQKCKRCTVAPMETPRFDRDIIDALLEKLMEKIRQKCYRERVGEINRSFRNSQVQGPHEPAHCEACMEGVCRVEKDLTATESDLTAMFSDISI